MEDQQIISYFLNNKFEIGIELFIEKYRSIVERFVFQLGVHPNKTSDVVRDAFLKISKSFKNYPDQDANLSTLLYKITLNVVKNYKRKEKRKRNSEEKLKQQHEFLTDYFENKIHVLLHECIQQLEDKYKFALILYYIHDKSYEEIAVILQISPDAVENKINLGRESLKKKFTTEMNDIHKWLKSLNEEYKKLPEKTSTQQLLHAVKWQNEKKKKNWISKIVVIFGLVLFVLFAIPMFDDFQQPTITEQEKMEQYFERKKEEYKQSLGVESVDNFIQVKQAKDVVILFRDKLVTGEDTDADDIQWYKDMIMTLLTTPKQLAEEQRKENTIFLNHPDYYTIQVSNHTSLEHYLSSLFKKHSLDKDLQQEIINNQESIDEIDVPEDIVSAIDAIKDNGYIIEQLEDATSLSLTVDESWAIQYIQDVDGSEPYVHVISIQEDLDSYYNGEPINLKDILLRIEEIYTTYPDDRHTIFVQQELALIGQYVLIDYLFVRDKFNSYEIDTKNPLSEEHQRELLFFVHNHHDSIYWSVVNEVVQELQRNNWIPVEELAHQEYWYIFVEPYQNLTKDSFLSLDKWPVVDTTHDIYQNYIEQNKQLTALSDASASEVLSLFMYASVKPDEKLVNKLKTENGLEIASYDWYDIWRNSYYFIELKNEEDKAVYDFISFPNIYTEEETFQISIELIKQEGIWLINRIYDRTKTKEAPS